MANFQHITFQYLNSVI